MADARTPKPAHHRFKDLTGERIGRLLVVETAGKRSGGYLWRCTCDCGREAVARSHTLVNGDTRSCGCLRLEARKARSPGTKGERASPPSTGRARHKRSKRLLTLGETTLCLADWARKLAMSPATLHQRVTRGWSAEAALTTPARSYRPSARV